VNTFALEIFDDQGQVCTFYTVRREDAALSETDKFFVKYENDSTFQRPLQELAKFISIKIGDEMGALEDFFRFENAAQALTKWRTFTSILVIFPFAYIGGAFQRWRKNSRYSTKRQNKYGISGSQHFCQTHIGCIDKKRHLHYR